MKNFDDTFRNENVQLIAGIDEAGRGPLAGPVVAASVVLPPELDLPEVNDSKKLSEKLREELFAEVEAKALAVAWEFIAPDEVDRINILRASLKAMQRSLDQLEQIPHLALVDGNKLFESGVPLQAVVKGDSLSLSIASASIVAKVVRDRYMIKLAAEYPEYNWKSNKGYGTPEHIVAVRKYGPTPYHRKTFLQNIMQGNIFEQR